MRSLWEPQGSQRFFFAFALKAAGNDKIAMTVPVEQTDSRVTIREVPGRLTAVLRYSGRWTERNYTRKQAELLAVLSKESITPVGDVQSALYNAPYTPPFLRRNEVLVEIDRLPAVAN